MRTSVSMVKNQLKLNLHTNYTETRPQTVLYKIYECCKTGCENKTSIPPQKTQKYLKRNYGIKKIKLQK